MKNSRKDGQKRNNILSYIYIYQLYCIQLSAIIMDSVTKTPVLEARNAGTVICT